MGRDGHIAVRRVHDAEGGRELDHGAAVAAEAQHRAEAWGFDPYTTTADAEMIDEDRHATGKEERRHVRPLLVAGVDLREVGDWENGEIIGEARPLGKDEWIGRHKWGGNRAREVEWGEDGGLVIRRISTERLLVRYLDSKYKDGWTYVRSN